MKIRRIPHFPRNDLAACQKTGYHQCNHRPLDSLLDSSPYSLVPTFSRPLPARGFQKDSSATVDPDSESGT